MSAIQQASSSETDSATGRVPLDLEGEQKHGWLNTRAHRAAAAAAAAAAEHQGPFDPSSATPYQGGTMETEAAATNQDEKYRSPPQRVERIMKMESPGPYSLERMSSWLTHSSAGSLHDFDESEWTPKDSSYGAAIPVAGWIPKNTRRLIEYSLIMIVLLFFVYLVVATSIRITDDNAGTDTDDDNGFVNLDDDYYNVSKYGDDDSNNRQLEYYNLRTRRRTSWLQQLLESEDDKVDEFLDENDDDSLLSEIESLLEQGEDSFLIAADDD